MTVRLLTALGNLPERTEIARVSVPTDQGWLTLLPRHCDCLVRLTPGLFSLFAAQEEVLASQGAFLTKQGPLVTISAQELLSGPLEELCQRYQALHQQSRQLEGANRELLGKLEMDFARRFRELGKS
ncbi:hypothetical protein ABS71_08040 [bacterium SCN 62-11]|nr:MAG: hypothetical protein ABS71_08040 [bacterium SCN 62-11]